MKIYGIFGAGGFAREVMPIANQMLRLELKGVDHKIVFVDKNVGLEREINGYAVISEDEFISLEAPEKYFNIVVADALLREAISIKLVENGCKPFHILAQNSLTISNCKLGDGAIICPFVTITADVTIGRFFHANIYSYVAHDCRIGDFVTFAPRVSCNGNVIIEDYAYIGTGAVIKQGTEANPIVIGKGAIIGMGAVVTKSVLPGAVVVGNPAKELIKK